MAEEEGGWDFESRTGLLLAIFAAVMAISDLYAGKYGDDEILGTNEKAAAFSWYQSKSTKESLLEAQRDLLQSLVQAGAIIESARPAMDVQLGKLDVELVRYGKEKKEILLGSAAVGEANWAQEVDGEKGKVVGAKELEAQLQVLGAMGDRFDLGNLFFQLCLVFGAVSLTLKGEGVRKTFFSLMIVMGVIGSAISASALALAP
jgi:hypothetical protein